MKKRYAWILILVAASAIAEVWEPQTATGPETNVWRRLVTYGDQWSRHNAAGHNGVANKWRNGYNSYVGEAELSDYLVVSNDFYDADNDGSTNDGYVAYLEFSETNRLGMSEWPTTGIYPTPINWRFYGGISWDISDSQFGDQDFCLERGMNADHREFLPESAEDHPMQAQPYSGNPDSRLKTYWSIVWMKEDFLNGGSGGTVSIGSDSRLSVYFNRYWVGFDIVRFVLKDSGQYYIHDKALTFDYSSDEPQHFVLNPTNTLWTEYNPDGFKLRFETNQTFDIEASTFTNIEAAGFHFAKDSDTAGMLHTKWYSFEFDADVKSDFRPSEHVDMVEVSSGGGVQDFYMSSCEVPYKLWNQIFRYADSPNWPNEARYNFVKDGDMGSMQFGSNSHSNREPAVNFSIYDMAVWCNALSEKEGLTPCFYADAAKTIIFKNTNIATRAIVNYNDRYSKNPEYTYLPDGPIYMKWDADGYRPPTPAEWERAYDAGSQGTGDSDAWKATTALGQTHGVGLKSTNSLGLYDMVGNAWEFTWIHGDSYVPGSSNSQMAVGGGFHYPNDPRLAANSASPYGDRPFDGRFDIGLRLIRRTPGLATPATGTVPSGADAFDTAGVHKWKFSTTYQTAAGTPPATNNILNLVSIPSNTFFRGPEWHEIQIKPFEMSQDEISYEKWLKVYFWAIENGYTFDMDGCMGSMRWWDFAHTNTEPVVAIPWHDMVVWCNALSKMEGLDPVYYTNEARTVEYTDAYKLRGIKMDLDKQIQGTGYDSHIAREPWIFANWAHNGYRLPTLAEWECAARGGLEKQDYQWGSDGDLYTNYVWEIRNSGGTTHPVGQLQTNGYGLRDIQGNAAEALWSANRGTITREWHEDVNNPKGSRYWGWQQPVEISASKTLPYVAGFSFFWSRGLNVHESSPGDHYIHQNHNASDIGFRVVRCDSNVHPTNGLEELSLVIQLDFNTNDFSLLQGRCSQGNVNRNGQYHQNGITSNAAVRWTFDLGGSVKSSPVSVDGTVYVGGSDGFYAIDALSGSQQWKISIPEGVESSACVVDGVVYFGANDEKMYACTTNGTVQWSVDTGEPILSPVAVAYSNVFAAVGGTIHGFSVVDGSNTFTGISGYMYERAAVALSEKYAVYGHSSSSSSCALELRTGKLKKSYTGYGSYCRNSGVVRDGIVYQAFAGGVFQGGGVQYAGLNAYVISNLYDRAWREILEGHLPEDERTGCFSQPGVWSNQVILGMDSGNLYSFDMADGTCTTNYFAAADAIRSPITVSTLDNMVYFGSWDDRIYGMDATTGTKKWEVATGGNVDTAICVDNGRLYAGSDDGLLYCLHTEGLRIQVEPDFEVYVDEGGQNTLSVTLDDSPDAPVTVTVTRASGDTNITVQSGSLLVFNSGNWMSNQVVTLAASADPDDLAGEAQINFSASEDDIVNVQITAIEGDTDSPLFGVTQIEVTTNVLVSSVRGVGLNMSDNYYNQPLQKIRGSMNFEGLQCRQTHWGMLYPDGFLSFNVGLNTNDLWFSNVYPGAKFRSLSDPAAGEEGVIASISEKLVDKWLNGDVKAHAFFEFAQPLTNSISTNGVRDTGLLIVGTNLLDKGYMGETNYHWNTGCEIVLDDVPSNSFGNAACRMGPGDEFRIYGIRDGDAIISGRVFKVSFYLKTDSGSPEFEFDIDSYSGGNPSVPVTVPADWEYREYIITNVYDSLTPVFENTGTNGTLLIDDVLFEQVDQTNSSSYRDDVVDLLKNKMNIGVMRYVQMGGWSIEDQIRPRNQQHNYMSRIGSEPGVYSEYGYSKKLVINIPDLCSASEAVGCIPWICISGTIYPDEMNTLVEFLAGSTNTTWGAYRAETYNHPQPYTDTLDEIIIEFGNEAWNLANPYYARGYNGPNYWHDCIAVAKSNSSYNSKIKLTTGGQNFSTSKSNRILGDATNSDYYAIAPYATGKINEFDFAVLDPSLAFTSQYSQKKLFKWFMAYPMYLTYDEGMPDQYVVSTNKNTEFAFYEYNYHCTSGDAPYWPRRVFTTSIGHGVSMANFSLANLKAYGIRNQCYFNLQQRHGYDAGLWGCMLNLRPDKTQYRPAAYANMLVNKVRKGNLMETVHSGRNPEFHIEGIFGSTEETRSYDTLHSYAFHDDGTSGMVLFNYDLESTQTVKILLKEYVQNEQADRWELSASSFTNGNE